MFVAMLISGCDRSALPPDRRNRRPQADRDAPGDSRRKQTPASIAAIVVVPDALTGRPGRCAGVALSIDGLRPWRGAIPLAVFSR